MENKTKRFSCLLAPSTYAKLQELADQEQTSMSVQVTEAVNRRYEERKLDKLLGVKQ